VELHKKRLRKKPILEDWIGMVEKDCKKAGKKIKRFIENPKNIKKV
jgi:hypothetical protein